MQQNAPAREFPPLERVRRDLRVKWYRCPIEPAKLRELMQRSDLQPRHHPVGPAPALVVRRPPALRCGRYANHHGRQ